MYKRCYYRGVTLIETIIHNKPFGVCAAKMKELRKTTHKLGTFKILPL